MIFKIMKSKDSYLLMKTKIMKKDMELRIHKINIFILYFYIQNFCNAK